MPFSNIKSKKLLYSNEGFTLIELMVVVAILAIISSIALPSYTSYVARSHRADARTQLMSASQYMQRFYAANDRFDADRSGAAVATLIPTNLTVAPGEGVALYRLAVTATASDFSLTMAPIAGSKMASDVCGGFTVNALGVTGVTGTESRDNCWK